MSEAGAEVKAEIKELLAAVHTSPHHKLDVLRAIAEALLEKHKPVTLESAIHIFKREYGDQYDSLNKNDLALLRSLCLLKIYHAIEIEV